MRMERSSFVILILIALSFVALSPAAFGADSSGTDFWVTFPVNVPANQVPQLSIVATTATTGLISNASLGIGVPFAVVPGTPTVVDLPGTAQLSANDTIESKGIHVTSLAPIVLYGSNYRIVSTEAYLALPTDAIGMQYVLMAWGIGPGIGSELAIVGAQNDTSVTITPTASAGSRTAGVPFLLTLQQGETYFLAADDDDLTGTTIVADKPISVFGGHQAANVPSEDIGFSDHLVEQMFPTGAWGQSHLIVPLATRTAGDVVRVLASQNGTTVSLNDVVVAILNAGEHYETSLSIPAHIVSTQPVSVAQYAKGGEADNVVLADPFEALILPTNRFLSSYVVATSPADMPVNYLNIATPTAAIGTVRVDGVLVPPASFTAIHDSGYSGAQVPVAVGAHTVDAAAPIGVTVYGFDIAEGYGFPGGALTAALGADLSIQKTAGAPVVAIGGPVSYTIVVSNAGPDAVVGATVSDDFNASLSNVTWTCVASPGAACTAAGAGDINELVTLPAGGTVTYSVSATAPAALTTISNTATATPPGNTDDPTPANNSSTADVDVTAAAIPAPIPTMSERALILLATALSLMGALATRRA